MGVRLKLVLLMGGLVLVACQKESAPVPPSTNILLITVDTTRADHLGAYGYFRNTSPAMDLLASQSILFEKAWSPMGATLPTHWSLLTGTSPLEHGILGNFGNQEDGAAPYRPNPDFRSFAELAAAANYQTAAFVSALPLTRHTGIDRGFMTFDQPREGLYQRPAEYTTQKAIAWLEERDSRPFFLWVHFFDPHFPYAPASGFAAMFQEDDALQNWLDERRFPAGIKRIFAQDGSTMQGAITTPALADAYDAEIRYMDAQIGRLLGTLEGLGLGPNTAVALVGDHGEGLAQHNELMHGNVYGEQLLVPMMLRVPGVPPRRIVKPVSVVDTLPSLLTLTKEDWGDFMAQVTGADATQKQRPVFAQRTGDYRPEFSGDAWVLVEENYKLVFEPEVGDSLFDLAVDPHELKNLASENPLRCKRMREDLVEMRDEMVSRYRVGKAVGGLSLEVSKGLEALGYMDGAAPK
jgi:arylsulfatase A-like enzyme